MGESEEYRGKYPTIRTYWKGLLEKAVVSATNEGNNNRHDALWSLVVEKEYWEAVRIFMTTNNIQSDTRKKNVFHQDSGKGYTVLHA